MASKLGQRLRHLREQSGKSIKDFAPVVGVSPNTLASYERGETVPDQHFLVHLAIQTQADFGELLWMSLAEGPNESGRKAAADLLGQPPEWRPGRTAEQLRAWDRKDPQTNVAEIEKMPVTKGSDYRGPSEFGLLSSTDLIAAIQGVEEFLEARNLRPSAERKALLIATSYLAAKTSEEKTTPDLIRRLLEKLMGDQ